MWRQARPIWIIFPECEGRYGEGDEVHGNDHFTSINPISTKSIIGIWSFSRRILVKSKVQPLTNCWDIPMHDQRPWKHLNEHNITWWYLFLHSLDVACHSPGHHKSLQKRHYWPRPYNTGGWAAMLLWHEKRSAIMTALNKEALIKGLTN